jgi:hypothetical protein
MNNTLNIYGLMIGLFLLPGLSIAGDSWRCGNRLVSEGFLIREVTDLCGPPSFVDVFEEELSLKMFQKIPGRKEERAADDEQESSRRSSGVDDGYELIS